jgi:hypothetical protein
MRRILITFSMLLLVAAMSVSCNKNSSKDVATTWLNSFYHLDYETAKKTSTEDTKSLLATLQQFTSMVSDSSKKEMKKIAVNVKSVKEDGDKAIATYTTSENPGKDQELNLVKQNGKWLVQFSKNDQMGGASDSTNAEPPAGSDSSTSAGSNAPDSTMH